MIDRIISKVFRSKIMRGLFLLAILSSAVLLITACANNNSPAVESVPLTTPSETPLPVATLALTATKDPFEGLKVCRTWQEAVNCPITEKDFRRISDFVKANFKFPPEAFKALQIELVSNRYSSYISIRPSNAEMEARKDEIDAVKKNEGKKSLVWSSLSPVGKPLFFTLKKTRQWLNMTV